jgi:hypothetical protein
MTLTHCSTCGKERYTWAEAVGARQAMEQAEGGTFNIYKCGDAWHIGHGMHVHKKKKDPGRLR